MRDYFESGELVPSPRPRRLDEAPDTAGTIAPVASGIPDVGEGSTISDPAQEEAAVMRVWALAARAVEIRAAEAGWARLEERRRQWRSRRGG